MAEIIEVLKNIKEGGVNPLEKNSKKSFHEV